MMAYDPEQWKHCENITAGQFIEYVKNNVSPDAVFHVCGDTQFYIHVSMDGDMVCVDDCALSDLPEYEDREPDELRLEGREKQDETLRILQDQHPQTEY